MSETEKRVCGFRSTFLEQSRRQPYQLFFLPTPPPVNVTLQWPETLYLHQPPNHKTQRNATFSSSSLMIFLISLGAAPMLFSSVLDGSQMTFISTSARVSTRTDSQNRGVWVQRDTGDKTPSTEAEVVEKLNSRGHCYMFLWFSFLYFYKKENRGRCRLWLTLWGRFVAGLQSGQRATQAWLPSGRR